MGGAAQLVRGKNISFNGINLKVSEKMHHFIIGGGGRAGQAGQLNLCVETLHPLGDEWDGFGKNAPVYHVYPESRTTSE